MGRVNLTTRPIAACSCGPPADVELGDGRQRVGQDRQDGDVDALERLIERALDVGAARAQRGQVIDGAE